MASPSMTLEKQREVVLELLSRPGHEKVRALVYELLVNGLGAQSTEVDFERAVPEVRGRIDALLGRTVFEFKSDLRRERQDAEGQILRYLGDREAQSDSHFVGIATDGATFLTYDLRGSTLRSLPSYTPNAGVPNDLLVWLSTAVAVSADLSPTPEIVTRELGRGSIAWHIAKGELAALWAEAVTHPEPKLKRDLWAQLLERGYGASVDNDELFFQHTYLTIVAKTMAVHVLGIPMPDPRDLLTGRPFQQAGISGVVESDFFDWPLSTAQGTELVKRIALQAARFRLRDVSTDVLKGLYESLVDPEQRHDLGEYYTPDWLAARICGEAIDRPLEQRVLDPACGSGTFLFHAVRHFLMAADAAGLSNPDALARCVNLVLGVDVHPVAVQIARVTYLLAIGEERLQNRPALNIPVYLGDSLQWNTSGFMAEREVLIEVPDGPVLHFPYGVAREPGLFDRVIEMMLDLSSQSAPAAALSGWLSLQDPEPGKYEVGVLIETYEELRKLQEQNRDHIWGFVARNLVRPVWLSQESERAEVIIGNPPWLSYRYMSRPNQERFRDECQRRGIWTGGKMATHQDLSAYFFARSVELYLKPGGRIAFVMPYAAMSRRQFSGFRSGEYARRKGNQILESFATVRFTAAWAFSDDVQPLFPVPSCVLFAESVPSGALPETIMSASGRLPYRDATLAEAERYLQWQESPWPSISDEEGGSPYRDIFRQGATLVPRMLCVVERAPLGMLGGDPAAPLVQSIRTNLEKRPWKDLPAMRGNIEAQFLRSLYLGESVAPFRLLQPALAVIPWDKDNKRLLDADAAQRGGHIHLAGWLEKAEATWRQHGRNSMSLIERWDYQHELIAQLPPAQLRVIYTTSGTIPAAALLQQQDAITGHVLYWAAVRSIEEGRYLTAFLNSEIMRQRIEALQSRGQWGARHIVLLPFELGLPTFDIKLDLHVALAKAAERAEEVAAVVPLREGEHFVRARGRIRQALRDDGVAQRIDGLVEELLSH